MGSSATLNVLFIAHDARLYGANRSLLSLIVGLQKYPIKCFVIVGENGDLIKKLQEINIQVQHIPFLCFIRALPAINLNRFFLKSIKERIKLAFQTINSNKKFLSEALEIINAKNIHLIYSNTSVIDVGIRLSTSAKIPHIWHFREAADLHYNWKPIFGSAYFKSMIRKSAEIISNSEFIKKYIQQSHVNREISVVYNGVQSISTINPLKEPETQKKQLSFLMLGTITKERKHDEAIKALGIVHQKYSSATLEIVGAGSFQHLSKLVNEYDLKDNVSFTGYQEDPAVILENSFALLNCSRNEGMGRVTVEAMFAGIPVIGINSGGTAELIDHERNGLLYEPGSENLADQMIRLIEQDQLYHELRKNAYIEARKKYTIEKYTASIKKILTQYKPENVALV